MLAGSPLAKVGEWFSGLFGGAPRPPEGDQADMADEDADDHDADAEVSSSPEPSPPEQPQQQDVNATGLVATLPDGTRLPGARATFVALVLAIFAFSFVMVWPLVTVDDRGEKLPSAGFEGLYMEARSCLRAIDDGQGCLDGEPVESETVTVIDADGWGIVPILFVPLVVAAFAWYLHRKTGLSRPLTFGMLALAAAVLFTGPYYMPALIALAIGSFQARRAEMPARLAERAVGKDTETEARGDEADDG